MRSTGHAVCYSAAHFGAIGASFWVDSNVPYKGLAALIMVIGIVGGVAAQVQMDGKDSGFTKEGMNLLCPLHLMRQEINTVRDTTGGPCSHSTARKTPLTISANISVSGNKKCILSVKIENEERN